MGKRREGALKGRDGKGSYITDIVGVAVVERDPNVVVKEMLDVSYELRVDKITSSLEIFIYIFRALGGIRIVQVDANRLLYACLIKIIYEICWRGWVIERMTDIIDSAAANFIIRSFDEVSTRFGSINANHLTLERGTVGSCAGSYLVLTHARIIVGRFHRKIDGVVDRFDSVSVVDCEFGVEGRLNGFVNNAIANAKGIHNEPSAILSAICNRGVLILKVGEEGRSVMASVAFSPEIEGS